MRPFLFILGICSLSVGIVGIITPILPTTPFVLLAVWCLARSNPRWAKKIKEHPIWAADIQNWEKHGAIRIRAKLTATLLMVVSMLGMHLSAAPIFLKWGVTVFMLGVMGFIWSRPS